MCPLARSIQPAVGALLSSSSVSNRAGVLVYPPPSKTHIKRRREERKRDFHFASTSKCTISLEGTSDVKLLRSALCTKVRLISEQDQ